jgi:hypothetical protein
MLFRLIATWVLVIGGFGVLFSGQLYGLVLGLIGLVLLAGLIRDFRRGVAAVHAARAARPEKAPAASVAD